MLKPGTLEGAVALVAVVDHGGFAAAGRALGVAQSTVSRQVSVLEREVGVRLLFRTTRSIRLTEAGRYYYERARAGIAALTEAGRGATSVGAEPEGVLRVTMPEAFGRRVIVPALAGLCEAHPKLKLELDLSDEPRALDRGGFDLAVRLGRPRGDRWAGEVVLNGALFLVSAPGLRDEVLTPEDLASAPAVLLRDPSLRDVFVFTKGGDRRRVQAGPAHVANDTEAARLLACAGLGFSLLPDWLVEDDVASGRLVRRLTDWTPPDYPARLIPLTASLSRTQAAMAALSARLAPAGLSEPSA